MVGENNKRPSPNLKAKTIFTTKAPSHQEKQKKI
jgi:hypothetical protein